MNSVPSVVAGPADRTAVQALVGLVRRRRVAVLAGAGCSTESGIPDYRGPGGSLRNRSPMRYGEFVGSAEARSRYWARSAAGWPRMRAARPNAAHRALAELEAAGAVGGVITQNVDGLHGAAGSRRVVELHGSLGWVRCLECGARERRRALQDRLAELNPWLSELEDGDAALAPDGDAELDRAAVAGFRVPTCRACGGVLKPDVVFFGESVPRPTVEDAWRLFESCDAVLVVGSSLEVYSGRRFTDRATRDGTPIAIVNLGETRADAAAAVRVEGRLGEVLPRLARALSGAGESAP
jgi:NAD-dependent deacetylase sirtuin 4